MPFSSIVSINLAALLYPILNFLWIEDIEALLDSTTNSTASLYKLSSCSESLLSSCISIDLVTSSI